MKNFYIAIVMSALLIGCADMSQQDTGTLAGGAIGGLLGSQFGGGSGQVASAVAGTLIGGFLGGKVGKNMDETDRLKSQQALESQKTGQTASWSNPDNHNQYQMTPTKTYSKEQEACRNFTMVVTYEDGQTDTIKGSACRNSNGQWVDQKN
jgi:surface antigen